MAATTSKSVRLSPQEVARFERLRAFFPEVDSEADMIRFAMRRGLALLEAEVAASGGGLPRGMTEDALASVIQPRILVVVSWLAQQGRLPYLVGAPVPNPNTVTGDRLGHATDPSDALDELDLSAAGDISDLGGDVL